jgi:hypothetical protein
MNIHATVKRAEPNGANLQRFLIMRIGRPVHAAGAIEAARSQLTLNHPPPVRHEIVRKARQRAGCDLKPGKTFASPKSFASGGTTG